MPKRKSVLSLTQQCSNLFSQLITTALQKHQKKDCKYYTPSVGLFQDLCPCLTHLKTLIHDTPESLRSQLYNITNEWANEERFLAIDGNNETQKVQEPFILKFFLNELFESKDIAYRSRHDMEDYIFVQKFGHSIMRMDFHIGCQNSCNYDINILSHNLSSMNNLQAVKFSGAVHCITDDVMQTIGRSCHSIKVILGHASIDEKFTFLGYSKLVFKDFQTKLEVNPCCSTIEVLNLVPSTGNLCACVLCSSSTGAREPFVPGEVFDDFDLDQEKMEEAIVSLFENVKNLISLGFSQFDLEDILSVLEARGISGTKLEDGACRSELSQGSIERIIHVFPELKKLYVSGYQEIVVLKSLNLMENLDSLKFEHREDDLLYKGILSSTFLGLKSVSVLFTRPSELKLSLFASSLPNLEIMTAIAFRKLTWEIGTRFENLQKVSLDLNCMDVNEINFDWFQSFCTTIKEIECYKNHCRFNHSVLMSVMIDHTFPELEILAINDELRMDPQEVKDVLNRCPLLGHFETVRLSNSKQDEPLLKKYILKNNIDCRIFFSCEK